MSRWLFVTEILVQGKCLLVKGLPCLNRQTTPRVETTCFTWPFSSGNVSHPWTGNPKVLTKTHYEILQLRFATTTHSAEARIHYINLGEGKNYTKQEWCCPSFSWPTESRWLREWGQIPLYYWVSLFTRYRRPHWLLNSTLDHPVNTAVIASHVSCITQSPPQLDLCMRMCSCHCISQSF